MSKRLLLYLAVLGLLLMVAWSANRSDKDTELLQQFATEVTTFVAGQEREAREWVQHVRPQLETLLQQPGQDGGELTASWRDALREQSTKNYTILLHRGDSLGFWSSNRALPSTAVLATLAKHPPGHFLQKLPYGDYLVYTEPFSEEWKLTVLVPLRYSLTSSTSRHGPFPANPSIPQHVSLTQAESPYVVQANGQALAYLSTAAPVHDPLFQGIRFVCLGLALALLLALVRRGGNWVARRVHPAAGWATVAVAIAVVLMANRVLGITAGLHPFPEPSWWARSLGDWVLHLALLAWVLVYAPRSVPPIVPNPQNRALRLGLGLGYYAAFALTLPLAAEAMRQLVFHAGLNLDFDNILNLNAPGMIALGGLSVLTTGLFLFSNRLLMRVRELELGWADRGIGLTVAVVVIAAAQVIFGGAPQLPLPALAGVGLLYAAAFTAFTAGERPDFGWAVAWLLVYSLYAAFVLNHYDAAYDRGRRAVFAEALAVERDSTLAEPALVRLDQTLHADSAALNDLLRPWPFKPLTVEVRDFVLNRLYAENYLFQHYRLTVFAFDRERQPLLREQDKSYADIVTSHWDRASALPEAPGIRFEGTADGKFQYLLRLSAWRMGDRTQPAELYCFLEHEYPRPTRVYAQLFYNAPYKNLAGLERFDFAVQRRGQLVAEQGQGVAAALATQTPTGQLREVESPSNDRRDAVYKSAADVVAAVGNTEGAWYKPVYLFSLLFTLFSLLLIGFTLANGWLRLLPAELTLQFSAKGSLAKRIHYSNVMVVGLAFFVIGFLTYRHFTKAAREAERANLDYRAEAVMNSLRSELLDPRLSTDSLKNTLPRSLATIAGSLNMDVNLYGPDGSLAFTSREDLGSLGVVPLRINPYAGAALQDPITSELVLAESIAGREFSSQYMALRNGQQRLFGFVGVPSQFTEQRVGPEVSDFFGMLASLYVFLLLTAFVVTFVLARSIIRPVSLISENIRQLRLEDRNQPLEYQGDAEDELSELIADYNRMVDKLEESKVKMIRLEREGAWREMARQVAHDIKNPLTTMKLSMQQLERVSSNPEQAAAYLRKAITRLIEQIDSLAQIASEFSMFANLDIQEKHKNDMVLNDVVESVYDLFSEQKNVSLDLQLPSVDRFHIRGDKNHLIRVFNNLIINAIQAIPSDREGKIHVSLRRKGNQGVVQISDNGGGIPLEIRERVFEPNFTTKTSGSGLGLAICRKIIEAHDGTIGFETREGEGTDFFIELPITAVETAERTAGVSERSE